MSAILAELNRMFARNKGVALDCRSNHANFAVRVCPLKELLIDRSRSNRNERSRIILNDPRNPSPPFFSSFDLQAFLFTNNARCWRLVTRIFFNSHLYGFVNSAFEKIACLYLLIQFHEERNEWILLVFFFATSAKIDWAEYDRRAIDWQVYCERLFFFSLSSWTILHPTIRVRLWYYNGTLDNLENIFNPKMK